MKKRRMAAFDNLLLPAIITVAENIADNLPDLQHLAVAGLQSSKAWRGHSPWTFIKEHMWCPLVAYKREAMEYSLSSLIGESSHPFCGTME
jgi:hypothetical protein